LNNEKKGLRKRRKRGIWVKIIFGGTWSTGNRVDGTWSYRNHVDGTRRYRNRVDGTRRYRNHVDGGQSYRNCVGGTRSTTVDCGWYISERIATETHARSLAGWQSVVDDTQMTFWSGGGSVSPAKSPATMIMPIAITNDDAKYILYRSDFCFGWV